MALHLTYDAFLVCSQWAAVHNMWIQIQEIKMETPTLKGCKVDLQLNCLLLTLSFEHPPRDECLLSQPTGQSHG